LRPAPAARRSGAPPPRAQTVRLADVDGAVTELRVEEGESILEVALAQGLDVPHDCKMGVCMNCAARLVRRCC
jgi:ferredoxin